MKAIAAASGEVVSVKSSASPSEPRSIRSQRHRRALSLLVRSEIPFLVGGGYGLQHYARGVRGPKDLDVFVRRRHVRPLLDALARERIEAELTFPHWLGKAFIEGESIDIIYSSGNGVAEVDDDWFAHAASTVVLGLLVKLCPPEEMIWSKAFVMERERYDGADIAHLILACHEGLDWRRLLARFGPHWRVLLAHLTLFGFIYPGERGRIPEEIMLELSRRLAREATDPPPAERVCRGTLLSRGQYLTDVSRWGYADGRLAPRGRMTSDDVALWTAAIEREDDDADRSGR